MKLKIFKALLLSAALLSAAPAHTAEWDLLNAASAGVKTFQALTLSDTQVQNYVRQAVKQMDSQNKVLPASDSYSQRLSRLTSNLKKVNGVPLNFKVYQTSDVNAFACADGSVRVYTALMDVMSDDELLGIIGHEIGHVGLQHSKKAIKSELLTGALRDAIAASDSRVGQLAASDLGALGQMLVSAKYSQKQEKEADDYGYDFLKKNGKNPWGMVMALEKLQSLEKKSGVKSTYITSMFSSHPDTKDRVDRLTKRCQKDHISRPK